MWVGRPSPPTVTRTSKALQKRVAHLFQERIDEAIAASDAEMSTAGTWETERALHMHRLLWALPGLILRKPTAASGEDQNRIKAAILKARVQQAEMRNWTYLLEEANAERSYGQGGHGQKLTSEAEARQHRRKNAVHKAQARCLRSAGQLLLSVAGRGPPTWETVEQTWA